MPRLARSALIVTAALALAACAGPRPAPPTAVPTPPASTASSSPSSPSPSSSPSAAAETLGPNGVGKLVLGASKAAARASGETENVSSGAKGTCGTDADGWLRGASAPSEEDVAGRLFFSANSGKLIAIYAWGTLATPQGIALGSSVKELKKAYPDWEGEDSDEGRGYAKVAGNSAAIYRIVVTDGVVAELSLDSQKQDCYE